MIWLGFLRPGSSLEYSGEPGASARVLKEESRRRGDAMSTEAAASVSEDGAKSQGLWAASQCWKRKGKQFSLRTSQGTQSGGPV